MEKEYKNWIVYELESWAETFNNNYPDHMGDEIEEENETYEFIHLLIYKYQKNICSIKDYENILFHIWQNKSDL
ncbi:MAG: hypothetical protein B6I20_14025 [Bacteroidetes bacterium 4572_117]|nr:MAG: hypothetical protein B6I20_14025 [Bacteroidetes bacterium 4572_117]